MKLKLIALIALLSFSIPALAQDAPKEAPKEEAKKEPAKETTAKTEEKSAEAAPAEEKEEKRESEDGAYEWKMSFGGGIDIGLWFNDYERWQSCPDEGFCYLLGTNDLTPDKSTTFNFDLAIEASLLEGTRLSIFGGLQSPLSSGPAIQALYIGFEPAFAFRRDMWEIALGIGIGFGGAKLEYDSGETMNANLTVLRPFIELRRYLNTWSAVYGRFGFNEWIVRKSGARKPGADRSRSQPEHRRSLALDRCAFRALPAPRQRDRRPGQRRSERRHRRLSGETGGLRRV